MTVSCSARSAIRLQIARCAGSERAVTTYLAPEVMTEWFVSSNIVVDPALLRQCVDLSKTKDSVCEEKLWRASARPKKAVRCRLAPRAGRERARRNPLCRYRAETWLADAEAAQGTFCKTNVPSADSLREGALSWSGCGFRASVLACCRSKIAGCASRAVQSQ